MVFDTGTCALCNQPIVGVNGIWEHVLVGKWTHTPQLKERMKIRKIKGVWKWSCPEGTRITGREIWIPVPKNTHAAALHEVNMHLWSNHHAA